MKKILIGFVIVVGMVVSSCAAKKECWAYRSTQHYSKKNKRTPSREAAKNYWSKRARIATYEY